MSITIVADDKIPFLKGVLEPFANVKYLPGKNITTTDLSDADALIVRTRTKCNKALPHNAIRSDRIFQYPQILYLRLVCISHKRTVQYCRRVRYIYNSSA